MKDPALDSNVIKISRFFGNLFGDADLDRIRDPRVNNDWGNQMYADRIKFEKRLDLLRDKINGNFCLASTLFANSTRFLFQWVEAFHSQATSVRAAGFEMSRQFPKIFAGGILNAGAVLAANHYAASWAYNKDGLNIYKFWFASQFLQLLAIPVTGLSIGLMQGNLLTGFSASVHPYRLAFNAAYTLAVGMHNSQNEWLQMLYYPTIAASALLLRANDLPAGCTAYLFKNGVLPVNIETGMTQTQTANLMKGSVLAVTAFCLVNFVYPITLPQAEGSEHYKKAYFKNLREPRLSHV